MRNLITCLLREERIQTTDSKAKEVRRWVDRVITLGKQGSLHARRQALGIVQDKVIVRKLFDMLGPRFKDRPGGYTRIVKIGRRRGDSAPLSMIELVASAEDARAQGQSEKQKKRTRGRRKAAPKETDSAQEAAPRKASRGATA
jgi:large subunit ribosomal protein L17